MQKNWRRRVTEDDVQCRRLVEVNKSFYNLHILTRGDLNTWRVWLTETQSQNAHTPPIQPQNSSDKGERMTNRLAKRKQRGRMCGGGVKKAGEQVRGIGGPDEE
jgi:hypothetical protein